ncbi:MAG: DEAD/DEAH box helicase [Desertifilum sp. SIO1I2]|nr:DEAD/DEAH box helicase [Desertifilum sp. SIO1I2]
MAILHGSWQNQGRFILWGETWRRVSPEAMPGIPSIVTHPLSMGTAEFKQFLTDLQERGVLPQGILTQDRQETVKIALPTVLEAGVPIPQHSEGEQAETAVIYPWLVEGWCLEAAAALAFLQALPLGTLSSGEMGFGEDLRFWGHVARWSLDLQARGKFLPILEQQSEGLEALWQPLLDSSVDRLRLLKFTEAMPGICRCVGKSEGEFLAVELPAEPQALLLDFLQATLDARLRAIASPLSSPKGETSVQPWLEALVARENQLQLNSEVKRLETALNAWIAPIAPQLKGQQHFRVGFKLHPPTGNQAEWMLEYCLQAADDPEFLVDAMTIWGNPVERLVYQGRTVEQPQETFLSGLGLASRLYPPIEQSLEQARPLFCRLHPLQAYEFIKTETWRFEDSGLGVILPPSLANREGFANRLGLSIRAETPKLKKTERIGLQSLLNFKWELTIGGQRLTKAQFDRLAKLNSPLVEINGEWVELRPQDVKAAQEFFSSRKDRPNLSLEDALRMSTGDHQMIQKLPVVEFEASGALQALLTNLTDNRSIEAIATPESFHGTLRPYQALGAGWLAFLERWGLGACLADDMGMGKTPQLLAFLCHLQEEGGLEKPTLVVCPTSVVGNWEREVKKFAPHLKTLIHHGDSRAKGKAFAKAANHYNLVITSYALVYRDAKELESVEWQGVVLDEAQNIKNPEAKQSKAVKSLEATFKIALTGTPVENRLQELWSIMDFLNPGYLGNRQFFQRRFAIPIEKYGDTDSLQSLRSLVQPFILRRLKSDRSIIQDLPEKQENTVFCGLSAEQAELYQQTVEASLTEIEEAQGIQRHGQILALLTKLKQICNHPAHFLKKAKINHPQQSGKLLRLAEMLEEALAENDRALIFTQFAEWGKLLKPHLEQHFNREVFFLYGGTRKAQREEMIDRFQHDPQAPKIFILSLKAGGVGLNLTRANHVFHYDRWWNPAVENQATDRVFRIGQTRNVQVHKFVSTGTLEEKIHDLIENKKFLAEQVVGTGEDWLTKLDTDQLRTLLVLDRNAIIDEDSDVNS